MYHLQIKEVTEETKDGNGNVLNSKKDKYKSGKILSGTEDYNVQGGGTKKVTTTYKKEKKKTEVEVEKDPNGETTKETTTNYKKGKKGKTTIFETLPRAANGRGNFRRRVTELIYCPDGVTIKIRLVYEQTKGTANNSEWQTLKSPAPQTTKGNCNTRESAAEISLVPNNTPMIAILGTLVGIGLVVAGNVTTDALLSLGGSVVLVITIWVVISLQNKLIETLNFITSSLLEANAIEIDPDDLEDEEEDGENDLTDEEDPLNLPS